MSFARSAYILSFCVFTLSFAGIAPLNAAVVVQISGTAQISSVDPLLTSSILEVGDQISFSFAVDISNPIDSFTATNDYGIYDGIATSSLLFEDSSFANASGGALSVLTGGSPNQLLMGSGSGANLNQGELSGGPTIGGFSLDRFTLLLLAPAGTIPDDSASHIQGADAFQDPGSRLTLLFDDDGDGVDTRNVSADLLPNSLSIATVPEPASSSLILITAALAFLRRAR